ncbi:JAB1/MPN domain-containing protein [Clavulina sp. PMI_390]|nr:JAB1/MPN domain-containing protein [Clavulina sp. PMI_390]
MTRHQQSQGYVPSQISSSFADGANPVLGGTPNGLLFQPVGVTKAPPQTEPYAQYSNRPGSFDRASVVNGPYPRPPKLRQIRLPADTLQRFVALAALNTAKKKETLAMLYGKANTIGGFDITTLVLPPQTGQEDSCQMTNEELIVDYTKSRNDSIMLGWIHTHPTQSCFMSSMDLHTHSQYQKMMPECIAIVCAPRHRPNFGIFRLTDPPGLDLITKCNKQGFHPHPDHVPIYTDADSEHVLMVKDYFIEIVDLR